MQRSLARLQQELWATAQLLQVGTLTWAGGRVVARRRLSPGSFMGMYKSLVKTLQGARDSEGYRWRADGVATCWRGHGGLLGKAALDRPWRMSQTPSGNGRGSKAGRRAELGLLGEASLFGDASQGASSV